MADNLQLVCNSGDTRPSPPYEDREPGSQVCFFVEADASSGLLCRLLGFFAQLDLPAPAVRVDVADGSMAIEARIDNFGTGLVPTVAHKMACLVGVRAVDIHHMSGREDGRSML